MPATSIQQFRAALARGTDSRVAAYRELVRRPDLATTMVTAGWIPWDEPTTARATSAAG
jgi:hypothetical protein